MKEKIDVTQFNTLDELYLFIEQNAFDLDIFYIRNLWLGYRNVSKVLSEKEKAQWELDCLYFEIKGNRIFSMIYSEELFQERITSYPNFSSFKESAIDYVKSRADLCEQPILKARYNHLLWKSEQGIKDNVFAMTAQKSYLLIVNEYLKRLANTQNKNEIIELGKTVEILIQISAEIKNDLELVKETILKILFNGELPFFIKNNILGCMLDNPKIFKVSDFQKTLILYDEILEHDNDSIKDFSLTKDYLPRAVIIAQKIKSDTKKWHNEIGLAYLRIANAESREDRLWIKQYHYSSAINSFKSAQNNEKVEEVRKLYADLKPKVKLNRISIEFDEKAVNVLNIFLDQIKVTADNDLKAEPNEVYSLLAGGSIFPKKADIIDAKQGHENDFLSHMMTLQFDINKNINKAKANQTGEIELFDSYGLRLKTSVLPYLKVVFVNGIKSGHLTYDNFIEYLKTKSWIGKKHPRYDLGGEEYSLNWISILSPSIIDFFIQIQASVSTDYYKSSFVLCMDSLSLKFEGLFRDFSNRHGIPMSDNKRKGMQEILLPEILANPVLKTIFNEDDLLFFDFLFSNEKGINLRNNIAHSFYNHKDYNLDRTLLLIAALLRIAKYDYAQKEEGR